MDCSGVCFHKICGDYQTKLLMRKEERYMIIIIKFFTHIVDHFKEHGSFEQSKGSEPKIIQVK